MVFAFRNQPGVYVCNLSSGTGALTHYAISIVGSATPAPRRLLFIRIKDLPTTKQIYPLFFTHTALWHPPHQSWLPNSLLPPDPLVAPTNIGGYWCHAASLHPCVVARWVNWQWNSRWSANWPVYNHIVPDTGLPSLALPPTKGTSTSCLAFYKAASS